MASEFPKVSIIICTFNQQDFVAETLESVLAQGYPNVEIIVTDDGSTDNTQPILKQYAAHYPDKIQTVFSEINTGIPDNINRGLRLRTGALLNILDGDDLMLPSKIERQVHFLGRHPEATGCYHDSEVFASETGQSFGRMSLLYNGTSMLPQGKLSDWFVPRNYFLPSSILSRCDAIPAHGFDERLRYLSEVVFYAEVYRSGTLLALDDVLVRYRRHTSNVTGNPTALNSMYEYETLAYGVLESRYPELYPILRRLRISCQLSAALKAHRENDSTRFHAIVRNVIRQGALIQGIAVFLGAALLHQRGNDISSQSLYVRPNWVKRVARKLLAI